MSLKLNSRERPKSVVGEDGEKCYKLVMVSQVQTDLITEISVTSNAIFRLETLEWENPAC